MKEIIFMVEEAAEGGYIAHALGASIFTEADSLPDLCTKTQDSVNCHFDEGQEPRAIRLHFVHEEGMIV